MTVEEMAWPTFPVSSCQGTRGLVVREPKDCTERKRKSKVSGPSPTEGALDGVLTSRPARLVLCGLSRRDRVNEQAFALRRPPPGRRKNPVRPDRPMQITVPSRGLSWRGASQRSDPMDETTSPEPHLPPHVLHPGKDRGSRAIRRRTLFWVLRGLTPTFRFFFLRTRRARKVWAKSRK